MMKRTMFLSAIFLMFAFPTLAGATADVKVQINNELADLAPILVEDTVYVSLESLGTYLNDIVVYSDSNVMLKNREMTFDFMNGYIHFEDQSIQAEMKEWIHVPLRNVASLLGWEVYWDQEKQTVEVKTN